MFKGVCLSSGSYYTSIFDDAIKRSGDLSYYACRAPNREGVLLALSRKTNLNKVLQKLELRRQEFMAAMNLADDKKCCFSDCRGHRACIWVNFLPQIVVDDFEKTHALVLHYQCVDFAKTVLMRHLAKHYYITTITAYRIFISLITLVDWLIRLKLVVKLSVDNLVVDLNSTFVTLIDWSEVEIRENLCIKEITAYYQQVAAIVMELSGARCEGATWHLGIPVEDRSLLHLFDLLQEIRDFQLDLPLEARDAIDYVASLCEQREYLIPRVMDYLIDADLDPGQPPYKLASRKHKEG